MPKRVLILSDSLALPRLTPEPCSYEETWPYRLKGEGFEVIQNSIGGATSYDLAKQCYYYKAINPDAVVVQVGIVDCAPRFLLKPELFLLQRIPFFGKKIIGILNKPSVKKMRNIQYIPIHKFRSNVKTIVEAFGRDRVNFIGIVPSNNEYEKVLPGIGKNIKAYNQVLKDSGNFMSIDDFPREGIMSDFHHINAVGHKEILRVVLSNL